MVPISRPLIGEEEKNAVMDVLNSGMLAQGKRTVELEEAFAEICGVHHAVATSSGTTALHVALLANGIGAGDEVITSSFSFIATANSILYTGARPVFVDIDPETFNLDPSRIEEAITPRTKAIMPVHIFGQPCDMDAIMEIADRRGLLVIEDACQAHGAEYKGARVGSFGTGTFSLYPTKNITSGEGGIITTDDPEIAETCRVIRQHGMRERYYHTELGFNFRMTDLHAAIGIEQSKKLEAFNAARIANAKFYDATLEGVCTPKADKHVRHVYHQYTIRVAPEERDNMIAHLTENGIGCGVYYPVPIHQQTYYTQDLGFGVSLPNTEAASLEVISLPVHPSLSEQERAQVVEAVNGFGGTV